MTIGRCIACIVGVLYFLAGISYAIVGNIGMGIIYFSYSLSMIGLFIVG